MLGVRITGSVENNYSYSSGTFAGVQRSYSESWNQTFLFNSSVSACSVAESEEIRITVPFYENGNAATPVDREIGIRFDNANWDRNRGFFGPNTDFSDLSQFSGISLSVGTGGAPIRGTRNGGYGTNNRICRSAPPSLPIVTRPDTFRISAFFGGILDEGTDVTTTPSLLCLNKVVYESTLAFDDNTGGTNSIQVLNRFYCFASRITPCLTV
ncbi:MAG: hypothetical protein HRU13_13305 [Phycisphaerales bacterium]|nr:hypothetical protein [Phycisphaerales bacterium]